MMMKMELKDTISGMLSDDYKERFKAEYFQTKIRLEKLERFLNKIQAAIITKNEGPKHECPTSLLKSQQIAMEEYLKTLEIRAEIEGVEL